MPCGQDMDQYAGCKAWHTMGLDVQENRKRIDSVGCYRRPWDGGP